MSSALGRDDLLLLSWDVLSSDRCTLATTRKINYTYSVDVCRV